MSRQISLKDAERKAFRARYDDGLWDVLLGCVFLLWVVAPYLGARLGDFWSSAVFLPFWALAYLAVWLIRKHVLGPRIGTVRFGRPRRARLSRFTAAMLAANVVALIVGLVAALNFGVIPGRLLAILFGMILLAGFSMAAYFLDFRRLYIYGLLVGLSPLIGEWLWIHGYAAHHGFPVTFGTAAGVMMLVGLAVFIRLLHDNPVPTEGLP